MDGGHVAKALKTEILYGGRLEIQCGKKAEAAKWMSRVSTLAPAKVSADTHISG